MADDDILQEIRATRDAFAAKHNCDVRAMIAELRSKDATDSRLVVTLEPRPVTTSNLGIGIGAVVSSVSIEPTSIPS